MCDVVENGRLKVMGIHTGALCIAIAVRCPHTYRYVDVYDGRHVCNRPIECKPEWWNGFKEAKHDE